MKRAPLRKNFSKNVPYEVRLKLCSSEDENGCWIWIRAKNLNGYGIVGGWIIRDKPVRLAHRASYELFVGPILPELSVCHKCDVKACINPKHLFLGTQKDNWNDYVSKGFAAKRKIVRSKEYCEKQRIAKIRYHARRKALKLQQEQEKQEQQKSENI